MKERISKIYEIISSREFQLLPGSLAYSFFLAIIPILTLLFYLMMSLNFPMSIVQKFLVETFPKSVVNVIQPVFTNQIPLNQFITLCFSVVVMTSGCNSIIVASNTVFNIENSSFIRRMVKSLFLSIMIILLIGFMIIVPLCGGAIIKFISTFIEYIKYNKDTIVSLYSILKVPVSLIVIFIIVKLVYIIAPDEKIKGKYVNKGALFTTVTWLIVTNFYSYYVNHLAKYNLIYGNLANIVILLLWLYILAYIFVIGLSLNRMKSEVGIDKTNKIKLDEIRRKVLEDQRKE